MKSIVSGAIMLALLASPAAFAQNDHRDNRDNGQHKGWGKDQGSSHHWNRGERMGYNDWNSAQHIDYRQYHLRAPPRGYEWRREGDQFVLAAVATGLIASIIAATR